MNIDQPIKSTISLQNTVTYIDDLTSEEMFKRIQAVQNIPNICLCLGPERTRNEFLPYLAELLDDEEEVMIHLSEALGNMLDIVGCPTHADSILKVLEKICAVEEISVREKVRVIS